MESARRNKLKALDDLKKSREKRHDTRVERIFREKFNWQIFCWMGSNSLLKLFRATTRVWLLLQGWAGIFVTSSCSICHLWMRVIRVLGWRRTPFFLYFSDGTFGIFYYFSDLTISLPSERESRRVDSFTLNDQGAHPFLHTRAQAGRQAGRQTCVSTICLCHDKCVCVCVWVAQ